MRRRALERLGATVHELGANRESVGLSFFARNTQRWLHWGRRVEAFNSSVQQAAKAIRPDFVWCDRQESLSRHTIEEIRKGGATAIHFTPDPYFSVGLKRTRCLDRAMSAYDILLYCKRYEAAEYGALSSDSVYMPLGYCDEAHFAQPRSALEAEYPVTFVGAWESRRQEALEYLQQRAGVFPRISGPGWATTSGRFASFRRRVSRLRVEGVRVALQSPSSRVLRSELMNDGVYGDDYRNLLNRSALALGFLRKAWPDEHTTRTFEIPAAGAMLLSDRSDEHLELFEEGSEAEFFECNEELLDKVKFYTSNARARDRIAAAGNRRCQSGGYSYAARIHQALREAGI